MIRNSRGKDHQSKKEGVYPEASTSSRQWRTLKNPRIVCVSRLFRGKDRHSKVATIKGLRDRRVRLSVQTAIQLYDLQDKLGLNQPSKVVDWLLNAAQHEINKLPPLQMLPGDFNQLPQSMAISHEVNPLQALSHPPIIEKVEYIDDNIALSHPPSIEKVEYNVFGGGVGMPSKSTNWYPAAFLRTTKEATREWSFKQASISKEHQLDDQGVSIPSVPVSNHVNVNGTGHSLFPSFLNSAMPFASYHLSEPSNAGNSHFHSSPVDIIHNYNSTLMSPSLSLIPGSQQELCPSGMAPSMFLPYTSGSTEFHAS